MVGLAFPKSNTQTYSPRQTETVPTHSTIDKVLASIAPAPSFAALVGCSENGVPILFDLASPAPGSLLMASDDAFANRHLLRSMLLSVIKLNSSRQVNYHLITDRPAAFYDVLAAPHSLQHYSLADPSSEFVIEELCNLVCLRRDKDATGPAQILVMDNIDRLVDLLHPQYVQDLMWLLEFGPAQRVYVFAGYDTSNFSEQHVNLIEIFETRALGRIFSRELAVYLADFGQADLKDLYPGQEIYVRSGNDFLKLTLPRIDS